MKLWIKLQHWFYRMLIDYKTKKIVEFNKERENYLKTNKQIMSKSITDPTYVGSKTYINYIKVLKKKYKATKKYYENILCRFL